MLGRTFVGVAALSAALAGAGVTLEQQPFSQPLCAVVDISGTSTTLVAALLQAKAKKAGAPAKCVDIMLGDRTFFAPQLELGAEDSGVSTHTICKGFIS